MTEAEKGDGCPGGPWQGVPRTYSQDCSFKDHMYHVGDYVYVEPAEPNLQPHIVCIERLWQDDAGKVKMMFLTQIKAYTAREVSFMLCNHKTKITWPKVFTE